MPQLEVTMSNMTAALLCGAADRLETIAEQCGREAISPKEAIQKIIQIAQLLELCNGLLESGDRDCDLIARIRIICNEKNLKISVGVLEGRPQ